MTESLEARALRIARELDPTQGDGNKFYFALREQDVIEFARRLEAERGQTEFAGRQDGDKASSQGESSAACPASPANRVLAAYYDHFNDELYRGLNVGYYADQAERGGNNVTRYYVLPEGPLRSQNATSNTIAAARTGLPPDSSVSADSVSAATSQNDVPEGCTPADAMMLREANHALAQESHVKTELLREWLDTELDSQDEEYEPWMADFTQRVRAALPKEFAGRQESGATDGLGDETAKPASPANLEPKA